MTLRVVKFPVYPLVLFCALALLDFNGSMGEIPVAYGGGTGGDDASYGMVEEPPPPPPPAPSAPPGETHIAAKSARFLGAAIAPVVFPRKLADPVPTRQPEEFSCLSSFFSGLGYGGEALGSLWKTCDSYPQPSYCGLAGNTCENPETCRDWSAALDVSVPEDGQCAVVVGFSRWHMAGGPPTNPEFRHGIRWSYDAGLLSYVPDILSNKIETPLDTELHAIPRWVSQSGELVVGQVLSRRPSPFDGSTVQQRGFYWKEGATCPADPDYQICRIVDLEGPLDDPPGLPIEFPWGPLPEFERECVATAGSLAARYREGDPNLPSSYDILGYGTNSQGLPSMTSDEPNDPYKFVKRGIGVCLPASTQGDPQSFYTSFQGESSPALSVGFAKDEVSAISANGYAVVNEFSINALPLSAFVYNRNQQPGSPPTSTMVKPSSYSNVYGETISPDGNYVGGYGATFSGTALQSLVGLIWNRSTGSILHQLPSGWEGCGSACKGAWIRDLSNNGAIGVGSVWMDQSYNSLCTPSILGIGNFALGFPANKLQAAIWVRAANPGQPGELVSLWDYLHERGLDEQGSSIDYWEFCEATSISSDGTTIGGIGIHNRWDTGPRAEAFVVHLSTCEGYCGDTICESHPGCREYLGCPKDCITTPTPTPAPPGDS